MTAFICAFVPSTDPPHDASHARKNRRDGKTRDNGQHQCERHHAEGQDEIHSPATVPARVGARSCSARGAPHQTLACEPLHLRSTFCRPLPRRSCPGEQEHDRADERSVARVFGDAKGRLDTEEDEPEQARAERDKRGPQRAV
jgi:hypothetical protein